MPVPVLDLVTTYAPPSDGSGEGFPATPADPDPDPREGWSHLWLDLGGGD